jgi:hypothetical protein
MDADEAQRRLEVALQKFNDNDAILLRYDVHECCIAARLATYLQAEFSDYSVDIEYSRDGGVAPKRPALPAQSGRKKHSVVRPDVIVHHRGYN